MHLTGAIELPDGSWVRGRGLRHPLPAGPLPEHGLYLGSKKLRSRHDPGLSWPHDWAEWPDFLLPRDRDQTVEQIRKLHGLALAGSRVEVAWTRAHHHPRAVETPWQRTWVSGFPPK